MSITISDLRSGYRELVTPTELARLIGRSLSTLSRWRWASRGPQYSVDPESGRIYYSTVDVLKYLDCLPKFRSTAAYSGRGSSSRMEHARAAKRKKTPDKCA